jgi:hypothetical protein
MDRVNELAQKVQKATTFQELIACWYECVWVSNTPSLLTQLQDDESDARNQIDWERKQRNVFLPFSAEEEGRLDAIANEFKQLYAELDTVKTTIETIGKERYPSEFLAKMERYDDYINSLG